MRHVQQDVGKGAVLNRAARARIDLALRDVRADHRPAVMAIKREGRRKCKRKRLSGWVIRGSDVYLVACR